MASKSKKIKSETSPDTLMLAYLCIKGTDSTAEKISILFGLSDADIALVSDCAVKSVRNTRLKLPK